MNRKDYIENATKKILDYDEKELVRLELTDHLLKNQDFSEEIGYDAEKAEIRAVEAMGDAEEIAEYLGELHNDFYNPLCDVIFLIAWLLLLGGGAYLLNKFIFGDKGCLSVLFAVCCLAISVCFIFFAHMLNRNKIAVVITSALAAIGTGGFSYFVMNEANNAFSGSIVKLKEYIFDYSMNTKASERSLLFVVLPIAVLGVFALLFCLTAVIYRIKTLKAANTLFDNHMRNHAKVISIALAFVFLALSIFFGVKFVSAQSFWRQEYKQAYLYAIEVSENCKTFEEVKNYVKDSDYDFEYSKDADKEIYKIYVNGNIYSLQFNLEDSRSSDLSDEERALYLGDYSSLFDERSDYNINVHIASSSEYANKMNSVTLNPFVSSDEEVDDFHRFICEEHTDEEKLEFLKSHIPTDANIKPAIEGRFSSSYSLNFMTITGSVFQHKIDLSIDGENVKAVRARQKEIAEIIKAPPNASFEEIARLTNTKLVAPEHSLQEYKAAAAGLGSWFNSYKNSIDEMYYTLYEFYTDKGFYFKLTAPPYQDVSFLSKLSFYYLAVIDFDEKESHVCHESSNKQFKKVYSNNYCYSKNGVPFSRLDVELMPYFDAGGSRYMYSSLIGEDEDVNYKKTYCLVNKKGMYYDANLCFINSDGYLFIDRTRALKSDDGYRYKDANGNVYTKALETSWDKNGNIIYYDEYAEENSSIISGLLG